MFLYHNQLLPPSFLNLFVTSQQIHGYNTRVSQQYRPHTCRTNIKQFTVLYQGPKIWNSLPRSVISSTNISVFKVKLSEFLLFR